MVRSYLPQVYSWNCKIFGIHLDEPGLIVSEFCQTFEILQEEAYIDLITPGKFYSWKMYHLEDISESMTGYGIHDYAYTLSRNICNLFIEPRFLDDDASSELKKNSILRNRTMHLLVDTSC